MKIIVPENSNVSTEVRVTEAIAEAFTGTSLEQSMRCWANVVRSEQAAGNVHNAERHYLFAVQQAEEKGYHLIF